MTLLHAETLHREWSFSFRRRENKINRIFGPKKANSIIIEKETNLNRKQALSCLVTSQYHTPRLNPPTPPQLPSYQPALSERGTSIGCSPWNSCAAWGKFPPLANAKLLSANHHDTGSAFHLERVVNVESQLFGCMHGCMQCAVYRLSEEA